VRGGWISLHDVTLGREGGQGVRQSYVIKRSFEWIKQWKMQSKFALKRVAFSQPTKISPAALEESGIKSASVTKYGIADWERFCLL